MLFRAVVAFLALPFFVALLIPWALTLLPSQKFGATAFGLLPMAIGTLILIASVVSFFRRGKGTLAPWDPPKHLVVQDLYRFNRNPMYVGIVLILVGWFLAVGNVWLLIYSMVVPFVFHIRVVQFEEKEMLRLFGSEWGHYRRQVPRWFVRMTPYQPDN